MLDKAKTVANYGIDALTIGKDIPSIIGGNLANRYFGPYAGNLVKMGFNPATIFSTIKNLGVYRPNDNIYGLITDLNTAGMSEKDKAELKTILAADKKKAEEDDAADKKKKNKEAAADRAEQSGAGQRGSSLTTRNSFDVTSPFFGGWGGHSVRPGVPYDARDQYGNPVSVAHGGYLGHGYAGGGGIASLGGYSDGGRLLRGPGDGVSDDIPASIYRNDGSRQEARLADGEFVFPARIVSEIGNGSTEAGAKKLYAIMDRIQRDRSRTMKDVAKDTNAERHFASMMA